MLINKSLASFRVSYACHRMPGVRWIGRQISPLQYFKWAKGVAYATSRGYPADRRRVRYMRQALEGSVDDCTLRTITAKNILYRKWSKILTHGWPNWAERWPEWTRIEGEKHLQTALAAGKGAVLLSGHSFGFSSFVAPVLSQMGYRLHRTGQGHTGDPVQRWGRDWSLENWEYNTFGQDVWEHVRALNRMRRATARNDIVHLLITGFPRGNAELEIDFCHKKFFLDATSLVILESLKAPVLPCFATCDHAGRLTIAISPAVPPARAEILKAFGPLYSRYLKEQPEFAFFWRKVVQQRDGW